MPIDKRDREKFIEITAQSLDTMETGALLTWEGGAALKQYNHWIPANGPMIENSREVAEMIFDQAGGIYTYYDELIE